MNLGNMGIIEQMGGRFETAERRYLEATSALHEMGDSRHEDADLCPAASGASGDL